MLPLEIFISKLLAINALAASAIAFGKVTALQHEVWNDAMESATLVAKTFLASAQCTEVFGRFRDYVIVKLIKTNVTLKLGGLNQLWKTTIKCTTTKS